MTQLLETTGVQTRTPRGRFSTRRAACYSRASSSTQTDPEAALSDLQLAAEQRGFTIELAISEFGSGRKTDRPGWLTVMEHAERGLIDAVVCTHVDRMARSSLDLLRQLEKLGDLGVEVHFIEQGLIVRNGDPTARLVMEILGAVAAWEHSIIRERVAAGLRRAKARGIRLGRPRDPDAPDPEEVKALRAKGWSWARIADRFSCSPSMARRRFAELEVGR